MTRMARELKGQPSDREAVSGVGSWEALTPAKAEAFAGPAEAATHTERWAPNGSGSRRFLEMPSQDPVLRRPTANFGTSIFLAIDQMRRPRPRT